MKTFKDLVFEPHSIAKNGLEGYKEAKHAIMDFDNDYGISVIFGSCFYSNGINTYEVAVRYKQGISYSTNITNDVMGHLTARQVTNVMKKIQILK